MVILLNIGLMVQFIGAAWLVGASYKDYKATKKSSVQTSHWSLEDEDLHTSLESRISNIVQDIEAELLSNSRDQLKNQMIGFAFLSIGMILQLIANIN